MVGVPVEGLVISVLEGIADDLLSRSSDEATDAISLAEAWGLEVCHSDAGEAILMGTTIAIPLVILIINVALLVWIARDAKARGVDGAVIWMIFALVTGPVAFLLYLMSRPNGRVIKCHKCGNGRLEVSAKCLHCGHP